MPARRARLVYDVRVKPRHWCAVVPLALAACGGGDPGECIFDSACRQAQPLPVSYVPVPAFARSGSGDAVLDVPAGVPALRVRASRAQGSGNFAAWLAERLIVNVGIGAGYDPAQHDGVYAVQGPAQLVLQSGAGGQWSVEAIGIPQPAAVSTFSRSGYGDAVMYLPPREAVYAISGDAGGRTRNFAVRANGRLLVNAIIGPGTQPQAYAGKHVIPAGALLEVFGSAGVDWTVNERR